MIQIIPELPPHVAGFNATGKITAEDYHQTINPLVKKIQKEFGKINYLLVLNTSLRNYTLGAWIQDVLLGIRYFPRWNKLGIVSRKRSIKNFTDFFGKFLPSVTKGFMMEEVEMAKDWMAS